MESETFNRSTFQLHNLSPHIERRVVPLGSSISNAPLFTHPPEGICLFGIILKNRRVIIFLIFPPTTMNPPDFLPQRQVNKHASRLLIVPLPSLSPIRAIRSISVIRVNKSPFPMIHSPSSFEPRFEYLFHERKPFEPLFEPPTVRASAFFLLSSFILSVSIRARSVRVFRVPFTIHHSPLTMIHSPTSNPLQ